MVENDQGTQDPDEDQLAEWEERHKQLTSFLATVQAAKGENVNTAINANGGTDNHTQPNHNGGWTCNNGKNGNHGNNNNHNPQGGNNGQRGAQNRNRQPRGNLDQNQ